MMNEDSYLTDNMTTCKTFDGTWSKHSFTATHGDGIALSVDTGNVLDRFRFCLTPQSNLPPTVEELLYCREY